ncbi:MAG: hypothetical protein Q9217_006878 [Psora testacea]
MPFDSDEAEENLCSHLSSRQLHALFDILTHHEAYTEVEAFKLSSSIKKFGDPLQPEDPTGPISSPLVHILLHKFILVLPGLRDVTPEFWSQHIPRLATALADANLSESYDKGSIGIRKTLSTAIAALIECVSRGILGGFTTDKGTPGRQYDSAKPEDVQAAWNDFCQQTISGDLLDRIFTKAAETDQLSQHEPLVQAAHQYVIIIANDLLPYFLIRQTLKLGGRLHVRFGHEYASTVKDYLSADVDVADEGISIVSTVLAWDNSLLKKRATAIEQDKRLLAKAQLKTIEAYCQKTAEEQQAIRSFSSEQIINHESSHATGTDSRCTGQEGRSIVACILSQDQDTDDLAEEQHTMALDYLAIQLSIRDRDQLIRIICHNQPDLFTISVRTLVTAYEPIIRALHKAVDLSSGVSDLQEFLNDLISLAKADKKTEQAKPPMVEDFCRLLMKHQGSSHRFIHQILKKGPELSQWYREYIAHAAAQYKRNNHERKCMRAAGDFTSDLQSMYKNLAKQEKSKIASELDRHSEYLASLVDSSTDSMRKIITNIGKGVSLQANGPGIYLTKWQSLIDETEITPEMVEGDVRTGRSQSVKDATQVDTDGTKKSPMAAKRVEEVFEPPLPDVSETVRLLSPVFREYLANMIQH